MACRIVISAFVVAASPVVAVAILLRFWGVWDWRMLGVTALISAPLYFISSSRMRFDEQHPGWREQDFLKRFRGW
jgi:hypothetical protein